MNQDRTINVMDKMWDRKSEVIGRCGGDKKNRMTTQNRQESNAKKYNKILVQVRPSLTQSLFILAIMIFIDQEKQPAYTLQGIYI